MKPVDPAIFIAVAVIGVLGVTIGGLIQFVAQISAQRMKQRHDQMLEIRKMVSDLVSSTSSYSAVLIQTTSMLAQIRADRAVRRKSDPDAELELSDDYLSRLGDAFFEYFGEIQTRTIALMGVGDVRVADQSNLLHMLAVEVQNETGNIFAGTIDISPERAKKLQIQINTQETILLTMVGPRMWERHFNFRSVYQAKRSVEKDSEKLQKQIDAAKND